MRTQLLIENYEIELDEGVQFLLNKEFEHLSNPTDIINDWSKTVSIPFTAHNNKIFGYIYKPERLILGNDDPHAYQRMGIYFDPTKKLDFRLVYNNFVLMEGYAKMLNIKMTDYSGSYNITLNGQLGKIFQELKKITFDTTTEDTSYLIHGEDYVEEYIGRSLIFDSWNYPGQANVKLLKKNEAGYNINDILGWAPNNSFSEGFDYKSFQYNDPSIGMTITNFTSALERIDFLGSTNINPDTAIPNGMLPREIGEYRSYLQLPYIYWNKLFQIFQAKAEELTGYTFDLDGTFFTPRNPDWYNLVYILKNWNVKSGVDYNGVYSGGGVEELRWSHLDAQHPYTTQYTRDLALAVSSETIHRLENNKIILDTYDNDRITSATFDFYLTGKLWNDYDLIFTLDNCFITTLNFVGQNNYSESKLIVVYREDTTNQDVLNKVNSVLNNGGMAYAVPYANRWATKFDALQSTSQWGWHITTALQDVVGLSRYKFGNYATISITCCWMNNHTVFGGGTEAPEVCYFSNLNMTFKNTIETGRLRSQSYFILNDLWNKDFNLFDEILRYCKMYRIYVYTDDYEKKIYFKQHKTYFEDYTIEDWTNKLDRSKEMIIKPITFDNKYVLFNYEDNKTKLGGEYRDKYGIDYGEYRLATDYNFNIETTELFKATKEKASITNTDNVLSWSNLYDNKRLVYSFPAEIYIYNKDKDNKQVDTFGCFYYHNGLATFDTEPALYMRPVKITDDTTLQQRINTFVYSQGYNYANVTTYPKLDVVYRDNICLFNTPKENYTYINNYGDKNTIYYKYWEKYLDERYNIQNKVVTCYLMLTPKDWIYFLFNKFIKIDNVLYIVNKIYDYNIETTESTKVDIISVTDIAGYTTDNYFIEDDLVLHFALVSYINGNVMSQPRVLGTFETLTKVYFQNGTETYTTNNIRFTIDNDENTVYFQTLSRYVDKADIDFTITLHNSHNSGTINCQRYSTYPYPEIKLYESDGETERSTIYPGSRNYKLGWYGTDTEGLENKPTVTIENHGTGSATIDANTWEERTVMIQEGGDEWFLTEYVVDFNTNMTNYSGTYIRVTMVDKEGWHDTRDFPISV